MKHTEKKPAKKTKKAPAAKARKTAKGSAKTADAGDEPASQLIDRRLKGLADWRGETLSALRALIKDAVPNVVETVKWRKPSNSMLGVPVWEHEGIICTGETYKDKVKLTFAYGASVPDPSGLFNSSLEGNARRAIDFKEGEKVNARAFKSLVKAAAARNAQSKSAKK